MGGRACECAHTTAKKEKGLRRPSHWLAILSRQYCLVLHSHRNQGRELMQTRRARVRHDVTNILYRIDSSSMRDSVDLPTTSPHSMVRTQNTRSFIGISQLIYLRNCKAGRTPTIKRSQLLDPTIWGDPTRSRSGRMH